LLLLTRGHSVRPLSLAHLRQALGSSLLYSSQARRRPPTGLTMAAFSGRVPGSGVGSVSKWPTFPSARPGLSRHAEFPV
jgi:hypothetical protein